MQMWVVKFDIGLIPCLALNGQPCLRASLPGCLPALANKAPRGAAERISLGALLQKLGHRVCIVEKRKLEGRNQV